MKKDSKILSFIKNNIFTATGIATLLIFTVIFSIGAYKLNNSYKSFASTIKHFTERSVKQNFQKIENDYDNNSESMQKVAVDIASYGELAQGKRVLQTTTMLLAFDTDNHLHRIMPKTKIDVKLNKLISTMKYLNKKKYKTVFTMVPSSVVKGVTQLPAGITDYQNKYADATLKTLRAANIKTIDLRASFKRKNMDPQQAFFNTDHHWNVQTAFQGASVVTKFLKEKYKLKIDPKNTYSDIKNYSQKVYKEVFYGTYANAAERVFVGKADDITKILPKFDTKFKFRSYTKTGALKSINSKQTELIGPFKDSLHDGRMTHSAYLNNARVEIVINNLKPTSKLKCFVLGTSNTRIATAFLAPYFKELRYVDTQKGRFQKNIYKYVEAFKPDVIIFMYPAFAYANSDTFMYVTK